MIYITTHSILIIVLSIRRSQLRAGVVSVCFLFCLFLCCLCTSSGRWSFVDRLCCRMHDIHLVDFFAHATILEMHLRRVLPWGLSLSLLRVLVFLPSFSTTATISSRFCSTLYFVKFCTNAI